MTQKRRLFIVDGIISLPIALAGFLFIPDVPETSRAFYLNTDVRGSSQQSEFSIEIDLSLLGSNVCQEENAA